MSKVITQSLNSGKPDDFWATVSYYGISDGSGFMGGLATQGSFNIDITCNGYRDVNNQWASDSINGKIGASQISLQPDGDIKLNSQAVKTIGGTALVQSSMVIGPGDIYVTNCNFNVSSSFNKPSTVTPGVNNNTYAFNASANGNVYVSRANGVAIFANRSDDGTIVSLRRAGSQIGFISISSVAVTYNTGSDYRLKENVVLLDNAIDRLKQLKPSRFNFKVEPNLVVDGFIAHEAQSVVPEAVTGGKDALDGDGNPEYQGIDQSKLVPLLTAALQESISRIEALEAQIQSLI